MTKSHFERVRKSDAGGNHEQTEGNSLADSDDWMDALHDTLHYVWQFSKLPLSVNLHQTFSRKSRRNGASLVVSLNSSPAPEGIHVRTWGPAALSKVTYIFLSRSHIHHAPAVLEYLGPKALYLSKALPTGRVPSG